MPLPQGALPLSAKRKSEAWGLARHRKEGGSLNSPAAKSPLQPRALALDAYTVRDEVEIKFLYNRVPVWEAPEMVACISTSSWPCLVGRDGKEQRTTGEVGG